MMLRDLEILMAELERAAAADKAYVMKTSDIITLTKAVRAFTNLQASPDSGLKIIRANGVMKIVAA